MEEINSAMRSLGSSLVLSVLLIISFVTGALLSNAASSACFTILKGLTPILTTFANFEKIRGQLDAFAENLGLIKGKPKAENVAPTS